jgi:hypothetical protein
MQARKIATSADYGDYRHAGAGCVVTNGFARPAGSVLIIGIELPEAGYLTGVGVLSREEFDQIEFDAAATGDHAAAAQRMTRLAASAAQSDSMTRAEAFLRAGEQWLLANDPSAAAQGFERALADGGPAFVDPRVPLARALFLLGREPEARKLLSELADSGKRDPRACDLVAELLAEQGDLAGALDWVTAGVEACLTRAGSGQLGPQRCNGGTGPPGQVGDDRAELELLLRLRYRIRNDLGLPQDAYDEMLDLQLPLPAGPGRQAERRMCVLNGLASASGRGSRRACRLPIRPHGELVGGLI